MNWYIKLKKLIEDIISTPNIYVSLVVSTLIGGAFGVLAGMVSGGFIGYGLHIDYEYPTMLFGYDIHLINFNALIGAGVGAVAGAIAGGGGVGFLTTLHIYRNASLPQTLTNETIQIVLKKAAWISFELSIGILVGGVIGSLKMPGVGTAVGAIIGALLMLVATFLESSYQKSREKQD